MTNWDYWLLLIAWEQDEISEIENKMKDRGREGWELVSVVPRVGAKDSFTIAFFKRPIED